MLVNLVLFYSNLLSVVNSSLTKEMSPKKYGRLSAKIDMTLTKMPIPL